MAYSLVIGLFFPHLSKGQDKYQLDSIIDLVETEQIKDDSVVFELLFNLSTKHSNPSVRIKYGHKARKLGQELGNVLMQRKSTLALGYAYKLKGDLRKALDYHLEGISLANELENQIMLANSYNAIASVYTLQENFALALKYFNNAIEIYRNERDTVRLGVALMNAGDLYRQTHISDSALIFFEESKRIFQQIEYSIGTAYNLGNIGLVFAEKGKYRLAEENMKQAIEMLYKLGDKYPIATYQTSLADIYAKKGDLKRALNYAHSALDIGESEGLKEQIRDASLKLSELYESSGNYKKAYGYQSQYITYRDSINNEETIRKMADLRTEYEVSKKQAEVDLKQTEVDLLNEQARNNQIVLWSVIVILVLVLFLTYVLLKLYRVKVRAIRIVKKRRAIITAQRDQLEEVNQTKDKFFSIISHDIRGPISNFQGVSQLIQLLVETNDKEALLKLATMLDTSSKEISSLLDNLLEWAMSQQGRMPYKPEKIKLHELCNSNLGIMKNLATAKKINLTEKVKEKITVQADKNSVSTIIRNLVSNAIKFTPEGGTVDLRLGYEVNMAVVEIKDTGIGIPKEKMKHLFDFKGERSRWGTEGEKGVGLGLTLVYEFIELNKGKIEVKSEVDQGTTFSVYLPLLPN